jgi:DNA-binding Lrp family transcriptional regulator
MKQLKPIDYKLLFELMKDAKRSDRKIAKALGVSQPTVTRKRAMLEKELIDGYTAIPKWEKLGYEIFAITLFKIKSLIASKEKYNATRKKGLEWLMRQNNVIMSGACRGIGMDSFTLSLHKNYSGYDEWMRNIRLEMGDLMDDVQSVLVNLSGKELLKPLNLKYLAEAKQTP